MSSGIKAPLGPAKPGAAEEKAASARGAPSQGPKTPVAKAGPKATPAKVTDPGARAGILGGGRRGRRGSPGAEDAEAFFRTELVQMRVRSARGNPVHAVFDIDDVLCDTRARTVAIARGFDQRHDTRYFEGLTVSQVGLDGEDTCRRLGLPDTVRKAFGRHWEQVFWGASNFELDRPISRTVSLVRAAEAAGADVVMLTGRLEPLREPTLAQLRRLGLPSRSHDLFCRPVDSQSPTTFKEELLAHWLKHGVYVAWYLSAQRDELVHLYKALTELSCVLVEPPWRPHSRGGIPNDMLVLTLSE